MTKYNTVKYFIPLFPYTFSYQSIFCCCFFHFWYLQTRGISWPLIFAIYIFFTESQESKCNKKIFSNRGNFCQLWWHCTTSKNSKEHGCEWLQYFVKYVKYINCFNYCLICSLSSKKPAFLFNIKLLNERAIFLCFLKIELKYKYKVRLIIDESASFGVLGEAGRGLTEHFDVPVSLVFCKSHVLYQSNTFSFYPILYYCLQQFHRQWDMRYIQMLVMS